MDGVVDSVVRNNLLYDNHASGISLYRIDGARRLDRQRGREQHDRQRRRRRAGASTSATARPGNHVRNNILYNFHSFRGAITIDAASRPGLRLRLQRVMEPLQHRRRRHGHRPRRLAGARLRRALVPRDAGRALRRARAATSICSATSPAIDAGTASDAPPSDLDGTPRPVGAGFDIGAYELQLARLRRRRRRSRRAVRRARAAGLRRPVHELPAVRLRADRAGLRRRQRLRRRGRARTSRLRSADRSCTGCQCVNPSVCASGIAIERPRLQAARESSSRCGSRARR